MIPNAGMRDPSTEPEEVVDPGEGVNVEGLEGMAGLELGLVKPTGVAVPVTVMRVFGALKPLSPCCSQLFPP